MITAEQREQMVGSALAAGFDLAGVAAVPVESSVEEAQQKGRFLQWAAQGFAGEMAWMLRPGADGAPMRSSLHKAVPWARSVILCASNYNSSQPRSIDAAPPGSGWIARYAWSGDGEAPTDYHEVLLAQLRTVEAAVHATLGAGASDPLQTRAYVDTGPVVERWFAQLAGIGWIGKNTCVLNQSLGSWTLLGVILTSAPLAAAAVHLPAADRCGTCTRCLDACPTNALIAPRQMDASRCIAYLTIEKKGSIDPELREGMGRQVFGCDICQDVCPWNRRSPIGANPALQPRTQLVNPSLSDLAAMDNAAFKRTFRGSPLERTGLKRLRRNVAIAMGNGADPAHHATLQAWSTGDDSVLAEAAHWALARLAGVVPAADATPTTPGNASASIVPIGPDHLCRARPDSLRCPSLRRPTGLNPICRKTALPANGSRPPVRWSRRRVNASCGLSRLKADRLRSLEHCFAT